MNSHKWLGTEFTVHEYGIADWPDGGGVYILAKRTSGPVGEILLRGAHRWEALYVGKAEKSFRERLRDHEKLPDALALGLTHVHVRVAGATGQTLLEDTLIAELQPPLNVQGK